MPQTAIAADIAQPRDVLAKLSPQLALDDVVLVEQGRQSGQFILAQVAGPDGPVDACLVAQVATRLRSNAVQVRKRDGRRPVVRDVDTK
jgi:hypothetical protein